MSPFIILAVGGLVIHAAASGDTTSLVQKQLSLVEGSPSLLHYDDYYYFYDHYHNVPMLRRYNEHHRGLRPLRVALIGDSLLFGNGSYSFDGRQEEELLARPVLRKRGSVAVELKRLLEDQFAGTRQVEVSVFARGGTAAMSKDHLVKKDCDPIQANNLIKNGSCSFPDAPEFEAASKYAADVEVVMLGTNDAKNDVSIIGQFWRQDMRHLLNALSQKQNKHKKGHSPRLLLLDPPGIEREKCGGKDCPWQLDSLSEVQAAMADLATEMSIPYASLKDRVSTDLLVEDGVHLKQEGCFVAAEAILGMVLATGV